MNTILRFLILPLILIAPLCSNSQNYRDVFYEKINSSNDLAFTYCDSLLISREARIRAFAYGGKGFIFSRKGNYQEAENSFQKAEFALGQIANKKMRGEEKLYVLNFYCLYLIAIHQVEEANTKVNEGLVLAKQLKNLEMQIKFRRLLGTCYSLLGLHYKAVEMGNQTIENIRASKAKLSKDFYDENLLYAYINTGQRVFKLFLKDSTRNKAFLDSCEYYTSGGRAHIKNQNFQPNLEQNLQFLGLESAKLFFKGEYEKALPVFQHILSIVEAKHLKKSSYQMKFRIAECYFFLQEFENAKRIFDSMVKEELKRFKLHKNSILINFYYAQIYRNLGDIENALKYSELYSSEIDAFYKNKSDLKVKIFTENELKERKAILEELNDTQIKVKNLNIYLWGGGILFIFGIPVVVFYTRNQKRKLKEKIQKLSIFIEEIKQNKPVPSEIKIDKKKAKTILDKIKEVEEEELFKLPEYSLGMLAKKVEVNSTYVSKIINKYWSKTFIEYTNELRINYVLLKLEGDPMYRKFTLQAIAESIGYKSLNSFNKHFKSATGISPKQYVSYQLSQKDIKKVGTS